MNILAKAIQLSINFEATIAMDGLKARKKAMEKAMEEAKVLYDFLTEHLDGGRSPMIFWSVSATASPRTCYRHRQLMPGGAVSGSRTCRGCSKPTTSTNTSNSPA